MKAIEPNEQINYFRNKKSSHNKMYSIISEIVKKPYDTVRMAVKRGSFSPLEFKAIEQYFEIDFENESENLNIVSEPKFEYEKKINHKSGVPYFDMDVTGSIVSSFTDIKEKPDYFIDFKPFNDCDAWLTIYGDSMYPMYSSGEMVAVKKVVNFDILLWGESYLVITTPEANDLRTIKLVFQHENNNSVILRASNPNFKGDTVIEKQHIISMWAIKGKVNRKQL